jgi:enoyl-CoA hydratase/carnithine racemase
MSELALFERVGARGVLTINRPEQRNALSTALLAALHARLDEAEEAARGGMTVLTLTGAGRSFCAGMDLKEVIIDPAGVDGSPPEVPGRLLLELARLCDRVRALRCVVVAKVNGAAIGGGCGLSCVCDVSLTHADAKVGFPEVDLGLCPAVVAPWVVRKMGGGRARAVLLRGGVMSGAEAGAIGLVDEVAADRESLDVVWGALVERLSEGGAAALAATKRLLNEVEGSGDGEVGKRGAALSARVLGMEEGQARLRGRK